MPGTLNAKFSSHLRCRERQLECDGAFAYMLPILNLPQAYIILNHASGFPRNYFLLGEFTSMPSRELSTSAACPAARETILYREAVSVERANRAPRMLQQFVVDAEKLNH